MKLSESSGGSIVLLHSTIIPPGSTKVPPGSTTVLPGSTIEYYSTSSAIVLLSGTIVPPFCQNLGFLVMLRSQKLKNIKCNQDLKEFFKNSYFKPV